MKNKLIYKIFGMQHSLTRSEMEDAMHANEHFDFDLESKLMSSAFDDDAFDGFKSSGVQIHEMRGIDQRIQKLISRPSSNGFKTWFLASWIGIFTLLLMSPFLLDSIPQENAIGKNEPNNSENTGTNALSYENENTVIVENTDEYDERFTVSILHFDKEHRDQSNQNTSNTDINAAQIIDDLPERIEVRTAEILIMRSKDIGIKKAKAKEIALHNHIFIDFRGLRPEQKIKMEATLTGLGANFSSVDNKIDNNDQFEGPYEVSYHDYLTQTALLINAQDFKSALKQFNIILKHYPNDENALFYGAYCHYQIGQYEEGLILLERLTKSTYANFDEEREWYLLKCYSKLNRTNDAKLMAEKIANAGGFYSEQARDFLKKR